MKNVMVILSALTVSAFSHAKDIECYSAEKENELILYTSGSFEKNKITGVTVFDGNQKLRFTDSKMGMVDRHTWVLEAKNKDNTQILLEYKFSYDSEEGTLFIFHSDNQVTIEKVNCTLK